MRNFNSYFLKNVRLRRQKHNMRYDYTKINKSDLKGTYRTHTQQLEPTALEDIGAVESSPCPEGAK